MSKRCDESPHDWAPVVVAGVQRSLTVAALFRARSQQNRARQQAIRASLVLVRRVRSLTVAALLLGITLLYANGPDFVFSNMFDNVVAEVLVPGDTPVLRGMIVHAANYTLKPHDRWAEFGRSIGFAHVALNMDNVRSAGNRGPRLRAALDRALKECAEQTGRRELLNVPFAGTGHSAGGLVTPTLLATPERVLTLTIDCGWVSDPRKLKPADKTVPMLFTLGAIPDAFKMLPGVDDNFVPARADGWPWALGLQHGCAHDFGNAAALQIPWMAGIIAARLPSDADARQGIPELRPVKLEDGWLGDVTSISNQWATIAPWVEFKGDRSQAAWFPNRAVAFVWRAWQTKDSLVHLEAAAADGSAKLPPWSPKSARDLMLNPGMDVRLGVAIREGVTVKEVEFFDGDMPLGKVTVAPWQLTWARPSQGAHAVHTVWTTSDGRRGAANPALVVVRGKGGTK